MATVMATVTATDGKEGGGRNGPSPISVRCWMDGIRFLRLETDIQTRGEQSRPPESRLPSQV